MSEPIEPSRQVSADQVTEVTDARVHLVGDEKVSVEFRIQDLVRQLAGPDELLSSCGGCNGCMGCSM